MTNIDSTVKRCRVSVIIKALNEEKRIVSAIQTALAAVDEVGGEVILADSCSSDRTIELASKFPIKIFQLANPQERCCGVGPQLGYQHSIGDFVYILDGDMEMLPGFLPAALAFMDENPQVAGVGGRVVEMNTTSLEYLSRVERGLAHMQAGEVDRLDMGGLYRRSAVQETKYFSNRNLHSYEEFDLAVRLRAKGWALWRVNMDAVKHHGHDAPPYDLLIRRWRSQYICGLGELLRAAWGQPHLRIALQGVRELRIYVSVLVWWFALLLIFGVAIKEITALLLLGLLALLPFSVMAWRKRSVSKAIFSVVSWCFNAAGLVRGLLSVPKDTTIRIASVKILSPNNH
ncbi:glycosyltransferase involved in cell wall biosynthesis [Rhodoferax ferrireducens]|uniref:Glycosyltransferase involved in cell wall biosynthesis n=1 Tax=Rhodoferax ferrireducens TaxID=192843 RepID=A0ABU2C6C2_9BURK|nr:glycosyltransferase [Rhodoferax ferrireducens]MDR7376895.1 glycosyltransferase involved in cell wall biosynthesis [Rhodoferax ferrireducens]